MTYIPTNDPVQVLRNAADYLEANGWTQGGYFYGVAVGGPLTACALGAIQIAVVGEPVDVFADGFNVNPETDRQFMAVLEAAGLVVDHLRQEHNTAQLRWLFKVSTLAKWNDRNGRTAAEVISALRCAADWYERSHGEVIS